MPPPAPSGGMAEAAPEPPRPPRPMSSPPPMAPEPRTRPPRPAPGTLPPPMSAAAPAVAREPAPAPVPAPAPAPAPTPAPAPMPGPAPAATPRPRLVGAGARRIAPRPVPSSLRRGVHLEPLDPKVIKLLDLQTSILERLRAKLDLDNIPVERLGDEDLWQKAERAIVDLVETLESSGELPKYIEQETLIKETLNEALGLGPLEDLLADDGVDEIIVDRRDRIVVGKDGALRGSGKAFSSDDVLRRVVERLVAPTGHVIDDGKPAGRRPPARRLAPGRRGVAGRDPERVPGPAQAARRQPHR